MSVPYRPHTLTVTRPETSGEVPGQVDSVSVRGMLYPLTAGSVYQTYGVEIANPCEVLVNLSDVDNFEVGGEVATGATRYQIEAVTRMDLSLALDHGKILLSRIMR